MPKMLLKNFLMHLGPSPSFFHFVLMDRAVAVLQQRIQNLCLTQGWVLQGCDVRKGVILLIKHLKNKVP